MYLSVGKRISTVASKRKGITVQVISSKNTMKMKVLVRFNSSKSRCKNASHNKTESENTGCNTNEEFKEFSFVMLDVR